jgi:hypothetical protein
MTKSQYRQYVESEHWQQRRRKFLSASPFCNRCNLPRWLAAIAFDQDLAVHHKNYVNVGAELDGDLEALCRRCHEIETFGRSDLRELWSRPCENCGKLIYDRFHEGACDYCIGLREGVSVAEVEYEMEVQD